MALDTVNFKTDEELLDAKSLTPYNLYANEDRGDIFTKMPLETQMGFNPEQPYFQPFEHPKFEEKDEKQGFFATAGHEFSENNELFEAGRSVSEFAEHFNALSDPVPDGWTPYTKDSLNDIDQKYWSYIFDAISPKEQEARRQSILSKQTESESYNNGILMFNEEGENSIQQQLNSPVITDAYLKRITQSDDLLSVNSIELSINTESQSISDLFKLLPNLVELHFVNSFISSLRDFGHGIHCLKVLNAPSCGLFSLHSIGNYFPCLTELTLTGNQCNTDLASLLELNQLKILNLTANNITDYEEIDWLAELASLKHLFLAKNPISSNKYYRMIIANKLKQLKSLDANKLSKQEKQLLTEEKIEELVASKETINIEIEEISYANVTAEQTETYNKLKQMESENNNNSSGSSSNSNSRPSSGNNRPSTAAGRVAASIRPGSAIGTRPNSAANTSRPLSGSSHRPRTGSITGDTTENDQRSLNEFVEELEASSSLTYGAENGIIAGNIASALRNRRKAQINANNNNNIPITTNTETISNTNMNSDNSTNNIGNEGGISNPSIIMRRNSNSTDTTNIPTNQPIRAVHAFKINNTNPNLVNPNSSIAPASPIARVSNFLLITVNLKRRLIIVIIATI